MALLAVFAKCFGEVSGCPAFFTSGDCLCAAAGILVLANGGPNTGNSGLARSMAASVGVPVRSRYVVGGIVEFAAWRTRHRVPDDAGIRVSMPRSSGAAPITGIGSLARSRLRTSRPPLRPHALSRNTGCTTVSASSKSNDTSPRWANASASLIGRGALWIERLLEHLLDERMEADGTGTLHLREVTLPLA